MKNIHSWQEKTLDTSDYHFKHLAGKSYGGFLHLIVYTLVAAVIELHEINQHLKSKEFNFKTKD